MKQYEYLIETSFIICQNKTRKLQIYLLSITILQTSCYHKKYLNSSVTFS